MVPVSPRRSTHVKHLESRAVCASHGTADPLAAMLAASDQYQYAVLPENCVAVARLDSKVTPICPSPALGAIMLCLSYRVPHRVRQPLCAASTCPPRAVHSPRPPPRLDQSPSHQLLNPFHPHSQASPPRRTASSPIPPTRRPTRAGVTLGCHALPTPARMRAAAPRCLGRMPQPARLGGAQAAHRREAHAPSCLAPSCPIGYQSPRRRVAQSQAAARPGRTAAPRLERRFAQVLHANPPMTRALVAPAAVWNSAAGMAGQR
mmetsp:Transcript_67097/g.200421  ORF Transcript_67097/g.200421 Transcript_67097/m.200421 type:complete len:262 (-) Transcript_67097:493-1278(-)